MVSHSQLPYPSSHTSHNHCKQVFWASFQGRRNWGSEVGNDTKRSLVGGEGLGLRRTSQLCVVPPLLRVVTAGWPGPQAAQGVDRQGAGRPEAGRPEAGSGEAGGREGTGSLLHLDFDL